MSDTEQTPLEALAALPTFYHPTASPDGSEIAFYYDETGRNELFVLDVETGDRRRISDGVVPRNARWFIRWDADGERVFYHRDVDGDEQNDIYALNRDGTTEPVVELDGQTILADVSSDGSSLLLQSTTNGQMNLYRHCLTTGETTRLTAYDHAVVGGVFSPDGTRVAYTTNESDEVTNKDVYVATIGDCVHDPPPTTGDDSGEEKESPARNLRIGETGTEATVVDWGPDGDRLLVTDNTENRSRCGIYDLRTDEIEWYGESQHEERAVCFLPDGSQFIAHRTSRASVRAVVYDTDGAARELDLPEGFTSFPAPDGEAVLSENRVLLSHTTTDRRPELLAYDLTTNEQTVLLEAEYGSFEPDGFTDAEYFRFESHDGLEIGALLYDSGVRPAPLIVNPHGGPRWADFRQFDLFAQFLVAQGYSVLQVNYRGSKGRGRAFIERLKGDWGGDEQADIAAAVEHVRTDDRIDADRIAVFGGSYGGYSAYMQLLSYPELYSAGVSWIGVSDLFDMYENSMPHYRTELMEWYLGQPDENPDLYADRSPITHVENLSAPLLICHGVTDRRVPISQARRFRTALEDAGYERGEAFEYVELGAEGHGSSDIDQKIRMFTILDDFLDRRFSAD
ncbi:S9 family peptidase [Halocatena pleomorpha]|uniref:S9 family peptidase n=1 Tax=Halocatena pleomorpha TaxID=1785090 RepID=A0A3P3RJB6_9EURY|nr:prolyl oligopeptidase family serine peptidase [Halocatena pleomorpha]RRJ33626.1 S9 family peptidase [Halocatena pleomorpha]